MSTLSTRFLGLAGADFVDLALFARAALHGIKQQWAENRTQFNQAWSPAQNAPAEAFRRGG